MLKVVHINKPSDKPRTAAQKFADEVLTPKWDKLLKKEAIRDFAKIGIVLTEEQVEEAFERYKNAK